MRRGQRLMRVSQCRPKSLRSKTTEFADCRRDTRRCQERVEERERQGHYPSLHETLERGNMFKRWSPPSVDNIVHKSVSAPKPCTNNVPIYQTAYFLGVRIVSEEPQLIVAHIILLDIFTHS